MIHCPLESRRRLAERHAAKAIQNHEAQNHDSLDDSVTMILQMSD